MTDIRTAHKVTIDDTYRVVVAQDEEEYEAAVIGMRSNNPIHAAMQQAFSLGTAEEPEWMSFSDAPRAKHRKKWVAVGGAIERFLAQAEEEEQGAEVPIDG